MTTPALSAPPAPPPPPVPRIRVAVIGTAGRDSGAANSKQLDATVFQKMCAVTTQIMVEDWKLDLTQVTLVSGGSAWSDHVAVQLFLHNPLFASSKLLLFLPCKFIDGKFVDEQAWHHCGKTLNELHAQFSAKLGHSTLQDIELAVKRGATLDSSGRGFFARNLKVGRSDYMIALSAATGDRPSDGGTAHTWRNATTVSANRKHVSLSKLESSSFTPPPSTTSSTTNRSGIKRKESSAKSN